MYQHILLGAANHDSTDNHKPDQFIAYLQSQYINQIPTQTSSYQWPPSPIQRVFELTMVKNKPDPRRPFSNKHIRLSMKGKVDDILRENSLIKLQEIFKEAEGKRKVILLEGAPGSGKSTLSRYICQQWVKGLLFQEYEVVILVQLRQPKYHRVETIFDLLPRLYSQAAKKIHANSGQGVLFILDGWDELPSHLRRQKESFYHTLIQQAELFRNPLYKSDVIVTSRPISCLLYTSPSPRDATLSRMPSSA